MQKDKKILLTISIITILLIVGIGVCGSTIRKRDLQAIEQSKSVKAETLTWYSSTEVATHNSAASCWSSIDGFIYDLTSFINLHPGGERAVAETCGIDGTAVFKDAHGNSARKMAELQRYVVGILKE